MEVTAGSRTFILGFGNGTGCFGVLDLTPRERLDFRVVVRDVRSDLRDFKVSTTPSLLPVHWSPGSQDPSTVPRPNPHRCPGPSVKDEGGRGYFGVRWTYVAERGRVPRPTRSVDNSATEVGRRGCGWTTGTPSETPGLLTDFVGGRSFKILGENH